MGLLKKIMSIFKGTSSNNDSFGWSPIRDPSGKTAGFWLGDSEMAKDENFLRMLSAANNCSLDEYTALRTGDFRIVENKFDSNGGVFLVFRGYNAPGE